VSFLKAGFLFKVNPAFQAYTLSLSTITSTKHKLIVNTTEKF